MFVFSAMYLSGFREFREVLNYKHYFFSQFYNLDANVGFWLMNPGGIVLRDGRTVERWVFLEEMSCWDQAHLLLNM